MSILKVEEGVWDAVKISQFGALSFKMFNPFFC